MDRPVDGAVTVGRVARAHGVRGDVLVVATSDEPDRFAVGAELRTGPPHPRTLVVDATRPHGRGHPHGKGHIVRFSGIADRDAAQALTGRTLTILADRRRPLGEDEFWPDQLVGLDAVDPGGMPLGRVTDVVVGSAQDRLVITTGTGDTVEVPFVSELVGEVTGDTISVDPPTGLFPGKGPE